MKSWLKYLLIFLGVFALVFLVALPLFMGRGFGMAGLGMRQFGRMPMMMFGRGFGMFGLFSVLRLLVWLAIIAAVVWGVAALLRRGRLPASPLAPMETRACANCGRPLQAGWVACPYCGAAVTPPAPPNPPAAPPPPASPEI